MRIEKTILVAGGGWGGCAAAYSAALQGAAVILAERTDMLLGTGLVGGIMRNNGRLTAAEELTAMGGGALLAITDAHSRHKNITFPGHEHASLYDTGAVEAAVQALLVQAGVTIYTGARLVLADITNGRLAAVQTAAGDRLRADVFIDATGTAGPMNLCTRYGNGCAMCVVRCPSFGGRVSLTALAGVPEWQGERSDGGVGAMSGSCKLHRSSLSPALARQLEQEGAAVIPLPPALRQDHLKLKACQQYALPAFRDNLVLLDTGSPKLMTPYLPLDILRQIPGLENARYEDPYAGGRGNSMRFFACAPRDNALRVEGTDNLLCCGEKAGLLVGHTEAIVTGTLAGYNAVRLAQGLPLLELPRTLATGEALAFTREQIRTAAGRRQKYTFSGSVLLEHLADCGLYTADTAVIRARVEQAGLTGCFAGTPAGV